jgi:phenylacetyl-CoA:acceptor oxidoreductase subunit 2
MELIRPTKQEVWGWPGVVNFILGGMAAGFYLLSSLVTILQSGTLGVSQPMGFKLWAPVLTSLGFLALTIEAGWPLRGRYLFRHLRRSWMSRETLAAAIFVPAAVLDWLFPHPALWVLAAAAAMGLMISHGFIVYRVRAVTAWNVPPMPLLFLTSGFATGGGLVLLAALGKLTLGVGTAVLGRVCVVLNLAVWLLYLRWSRDAAFREATEALRRPSSLIFTVGIGHLLPVLLLLLLLVAPGVGVRVELEHVVAALAGLAMIAGGMSQKAGIILKAGYLRGIMLEGLKSDAQGAHPVFPLSLPAIHQRGHAE